MKKNYFLSICLMLFIAVQATAQSFTIDQLFGKWQFTADVEFTDAATQAHKDALSGDCEAVISADETYIAKIVGFAGSSVQQNINMIGAKNGQDMLRINNLNNPQLWGSLYLANENGDNPYGIWENGTEVVKSYGPVYYNVYATEGLITIPDFTVVTLNGYTDKNPTIIAKYTNVKMTLVEAEVVEVADISGEYQFKAGAGTYDTMAGSVIPTEFAVTLAKTSDDNKTYNATIAIEGYNAVTLPASYNGVSVLLDYDNTYLDEANGIRFAPMYGDATAGSIEFKSQDETVFSLYSGFAFASDTIVKAADGVTDSLVVNGNYHQWYTSGTLKMATDAPAFDWAGVYTVKTTDENGLYIGDAAGFDWPTEFQIEVEYNEDWGLYLVTKVFGMDVAGLNYGGLDFIPAEDGKSVDIKTGYLYTVSPGAVYLALRDMNLSETPIQMIVNEDGTMSVAGMSVVTVVNGVETPTLNVFYSNLVVTKEAAEPEAPAFSWAGQHTVKVGKVDVYDGNEYPTEFTMTVVDYGDYMLVTEFLGNDVAGVNYGGIEFTVAADGMSAEMAAGSIVGGAYPSYLKLYDMNAQENPILFTLNEDGSVTVDNFFVKSVDYNTDKSTPAAYFQNVTIPAVGGDVEETEPFDWLGTWEVTVGSQVSQDGKTYPEKFYMTIEHNEAWGMTLITQFMSKDITALTQGGLLLTIADDNKSAEMEVGNFAGGSYPDYLKIYDMNGTADYPIILTANEDGTITFEDFFLATYNWDTTTLTPAVFCQNVTATKCPTSIEEVKGEDGKVKAVFDMQGRKVDAITAPGLYIVNGKKVLVK